jgi:DNA-directed RNA polymerase specialized sigma24 family protein
VTAPLEAALASLDWADLTRRLTKYAHSRLRGGSIQMAQDIAQDAIADFLDGAYESWDREQYPDAFEALGSIVNGKVVNHFRKLARRGKHVALLADEAEPNEIEGGDDPGEVPTEPPEEGAVVTVTPPVHDEEAFARIGTAAMDALRKRVANDTMCTGILSLILDGVGKPREHASALGVSVDEVYTAKRRLLHHAQKVAAELEQRVAS